MRANNIPLFALESGDAITDFDIIGFTLQYELCYSNVLNMLELANIPLKSSERKGLSQIVVAGGPCACNGEPLSDIIDIFFIGEGEESDLEVIELLRKCKKENKTREEFLYEASKISGVYVPSLYEVAYNPDGTIASFSAKEQYKDAPMLIEKRVMLDMDKSYYPSTFVVPNIEIIHDRVVEEIFRGCKRGCRFCQAGFMCRPVREKSPECISEQCHTICKNTGYDEISLSSLSSSDYSQLVKLLDTLKSWADEENVSLSLPSLRVDGFSDEILSRIKTVRKSGLTFAPEAGTQRLRDAINKNVKEDELLSTCRIAFEGGYSSVKLYFMIGLPTETEDDVKGIAEMSQKVVNTFYNCENRPKGRSVNVTISTASFVPKPFTPFQWEPQDKMDTLCEKQRLIKQSLTTRKVSYNYHDADTSFLEAVFARGDRKLNSVLFKAREKGVRFDSWSDCFSFEKWLEIFDECGIDPEFYSNRRRSFDEILPWDHISYGVSKQFLEKECKKAFESKTTENCTEKCSACGASKYGGGVCFDKCKGMV